MAHGHSALRQRPRHRRHRRLQLGSHGEWGLLGGMLLLPRWLQRSKQQRVIMIETIQCSYAGVLSVLRGFEWFHFTRLRSVYKNNTRSIL